MNGEGFVVIFRGDGRDKGRMGVGERQGGQGEHKGRRGRGGEEKGKMGDVLTN